jgi:hypothetical protein
MKKSRNNDVWLQKFEAKSKVFEKKFDANFKLMMWEMRKVRKAAEEGLRSYRARIKSLPKF